MCTIRYLQGNEKQTLTSLGQRSANDSWLRKKVKLEVIYRLLTSIALKPQSVNILGYTNVGGVFVHSPCYNKVYQTNKQFHSHISEG
jgi:hypothetical protein